MRCWILLDLVKEMGKPGTRKLLHEIAAGHGIYHIPIEYLLFYVLLNSKACQCYSAIHLDSIPSMNLSNVKNHISMALSSHLVQFLLGGRLCLSWFSP